MRRLTLLCAFASACWGADTIRLNNRSGATITNYPIQLGRAFVQAEIANYPQIGQCADSTCASVSWYDTSHYQSDVKVRWADTSVKHAIVSFVVASLPTGNTYFAFQNSASANNTPLSQATMLGSPYNFDATIAATFGSTVTTSAKAMLTAHSGAIPDCETVNWATATNTTACYWLKGPVNTTVVLADHSAARAYDFGSDAYKSLRPIFEAAFWPATSSVKVRAIVENANTETLQEQDYNVTVTTGSASPTTVYTMSGVTHYPATRWTRGGYWIGTAPPAQVDIDSNLAYLISTMAIPNYDTGKNPSETIIASQYSLWTAAAKDIYSLGQWSYPGMGTAGGRPAIGPYPTWDVQSLYTGDYRLRQVATGNADLAASWPVYFREAKSGKAGFGNPILLSSRPTVFLGNSNAYIGSGYTTTGDKITPLGALTNGGWLPDSAHLYQPHYVSYLVTGDHFYLEEMWFWQSWVLFNMNPDPTASYARGPVGHNGAIHGEVRGDAWMSARRAEFAWIAPDAMSDTAYYHDRVVDALASWEGERGITGTTLATHPTYTWAAAFAPSASIWSLTTGLNTPPPLHTWQVNNGLCIGDPCDPTKAADAEAPWMDGYLAYSLNRMVEMGYPAAALKSWFAVWMTGMVTNSGVLSPYIIGNYRIPTASMVPAWFTTWAGVAGALTSYDMTAWFNSQLPATYDGGEHGYPYIAQTALSGLASETNGAAAWSWISALTASQPVLSDNPKWAIIPRSATAVQRTSACDVNKDGKQDILDVQEAVNQAVGRSPCGSADLKGSGTCDIVDVQRIVNAALGGACVIGP